MKLLYSTSGQSIITGEWGSLSVNLSLWDMCEYLYRLLSTVWFGSSPDFRKQYRPAIKKR